MATVMVRVNERTHEALQALSASTGEPMSRLVERAVERLRTDEFFAALEAAYRNLRTDQAAWADEEAERSAWDVTLSDGIEQDEG